MTIYPISKQKASSPDPSLVLSTLTDYIQGCQIQSHTLYLENYYLQNQVQLLSEENSTLKQHLIDANERLAAANYEKESLTRSLAYANTEIRDLRCSQHPSSLDGESWEDWENRRDLDQ